MQNSELIASIKDRFAHGQRRFEIKEALMQEGWKEQEIDDAISYIQHEALRQLPGLAPIYRLIDSFNQKHILTTPRVTAVILIGSILVLFIIAITFYFLFDPMGNNAKERDVQRETDVAKLRQAIENYYQKNRDYPNNLSQLLPEFLNSLPKDPSTGKDYQYKTLDNGTNYQLCASYEVQSVSCINGSPKQFTIPNVTTPTPTSYLQVSPGAVTNDSL